LAYCKANFKPDISVSSQNVSVKSGYGAYTGELSAAILLDSGIEWTIIGHSERRCGFNAPV
jgi:triosephosphate isomerase